MPATTNADRSRADVLRSQIRRAVSALALLLICAAAGPLRAQDFNGDGKPDILWRNNASGENAVWFMDGASFQSAAPLPSSGDLGWRMAGAGHFNDDKQTDLVWQHRDGRVAIWLMKGTAMLSSVPIMPLPDPGWKICAVADFNADGQSDLVLQHDSSGEKAIWLMEGARRLDSVVVDRDSGRDWQIAAAGQFGGGSTPDLILRHRRSGDVARWVMERTHVKSKEPLPTLSRPDPDWQITGAADFNRDRRTDLLWRHATVGLNLITFLRDGKRISERPIQFEPDTHWRIAGQEMEESRYRLEKDYGTRLTAVVSDSPEPQITLFSNVILSNNATMTLFRRMHGATNWGQPIAADLSSGNYRDTKVLIGERYEYQAVFSSSQAAPALLSAGIRARPLENPGKLVLLVDRSLAAKFPDMLNPVLDEWTEDLAGDGWTVIRHDVPRHNDAEGTSAEQENKRNIAIIRSLLRADYDSGARGVFLAGHVAIPFSGSQRADGHSDHEGAWPADMYYGDVDGNWTDTEVNIPSAKYFENRNVPGDGKFDNDFAPSNLEMFVGRIDFARMSLFGTSNEPSEAEASLLRRYAAKAHRYRFHLPPYPLEERAVAYGYISASGRDGLDGMIYENAQRNLAAFYLGGLGLVDVGDPFFQRARSSTWGFIGGMGSAVSINPGYHMLEHSTAELATARAGPKIAFHLMLGSYFGDWNMPNNFMRATLAAPDYGLAAMWLAPFPTLARWRFQEMGLGEPLGHGIPSTVNDNPPRLTGDNNRLLAILGDPTLRLHVVPPPTDLKTSSDGRSRNLSWNNSSTEARHFVYRAATKAGPFRRISPHAVEGTTFTDPNPLSTEPVYLVRALRLVATGCGSYTNLSQGIFAVAQ